MKKLLIIYYSWSNGNTERIAKMLQSETDSDILKIDTIVPYSGSYDDVVNQGQNEVQRGYEPEIKPLLFRLVYYLKLTPSQELLIFSSPVMPDTSCWQSRSCRFYTSQSLRSGSRFHLPVAYRHDGCQSNSQFIRFYISKTCCQTSLWICIDQ